jgi:hypothetical protein
MFVLALYGKGPFSQTPLPVFLSFSLSYASHQRRWRATKNTTPLLLRTTEDQAPCIPRDPLILHSPAREVGLFTHSTAMAKTICLAMPVPTLSLPLVRRRLRRLLTAAGTSAGMVTAAEMTMTIAAQAPTGNVAPLACPHGLSCFASKLRTRITASWRLALTFRTALGPTS